MATWSHRLFAAVAASLMLGAGCSSDGGTDSAEEVSASEPASGGEVASDEDPDAATGPTEEAPEPPKTESGPDSEVEPLGADLGFETLVTARTWI